MRLSTIPRKAEIQVELGPVRSELDISIVDRLNSLLQPQKLATTEMMASHMYTSYNKHVSLVRSSQELLLIIVASEIIVTNDHVNHHCTTKFIIYIFVCLH